MVCGKGELMKSHFWSEKETNFMLIEMKGLGLCSASQDPTFGNNGKFDCYVITYECPPKESDNLLKHVNWGFPIIPFLRRMWTCQIRLLQLSDNPQLSDFSGHVNGLIVVEVLQFDWTFSCATNLLKINRGWCLWSSLKCTFSILKVNYISARRPQSCYSKKWFENIRKVNSVNSI